MAYKVVMPYHLHMPSYFLETFTEYPFFACLGKTKNPDFVWKSGFYCLLLFF